jgi:hypothetical protein
MKIINIIMLIDVSRKAFIQFNKSDRLACPVYTYDLEECKQNEPIERILQRSAYTVLKERFCFSKKR